jgi:preprotein translocase subunit SecE
VARGLRVPRPDFLAMPFASLSRSCAERHREKALPRIRAAGSRIGAALNGPHTQGRHTKEMTNPLEFLQEVRAEGAKVTWPTRRETLVTTGLVLFMVLLASLFFVTVDWALRLIVTGILSFGR